jgi:hypothetical protein
MGNERGKPPHKQQQVYSAWRRVVAAALTFGRLVRLVWRCLVAFASDFNTVAKAVGIIVGLPLGAYVVVNIPHWMPEIVRKAAEHLPADKGKAASASKTEAAPKVEPPPPQLTPFVEPKRTSNCVSDSVRGIVEKSEKDAATQRQFRDRSICGPGWVVVVDWPPRDLGNGKGYRVSLSRPYGGPRIEADATVNISSFAIGDKLRMRGTIAEVVVGPPDRGLIRVISATFTKMPQ